MNKIPSPLELLANRRTIQWLLIPVVILPVGIVFLFTFGRFFALFGDTIASACLDWLGLGLGFCWFLSLVSLLLLVSWQLAFGDDDDGNGDESETDLDSSDDSEDRIAERC